MCHPCERNYKTSDNKLLTTNLASATENSRLIYNLRLIFHSVYAHLYLVGIEEDLGLHHKRQGSLPPGLHFGVSCLFAYATKRKDAVEVYIRKIEDLSAVASDEAGSSSCHSAS